MWNRKILSPDLADISKQSWPYLSYPLITTLWTDPSLSAIILHWDGIYRQNLRGRVVLGARLPPVAINDLISNDGNGLRVVSDKSVGKKEVYRK
jgi:hypothetical protein